MLFFFQEFLTHLSSWYRLRTAVRHVPHSVECSRSLICMDVSFVIYLNPNLDLLHGPLCLIILTRHDVCIKDNKKDCNHSGLPCHVRLKFRARK